MRATCPTSTATTRGGMGTAVAGAVVAVFYTVISGAGVSAFNVWSLIVAAVGAIAGILGWHGSMSRYVSRASFTRRQVD